MSRGRPMLSIAFALALAIPPICEARRSAVKTRPLHEFLNAQGTTTRFFLHPDISGWVDANVVTFGLIDYPGVIAKWLQEPNNVDLGTTLTGSVHEWELADGRALITVALHADNALGFAQATKDLIGSGFNWEGTAEVFGSKASEVAAGATPALGYTHLSLSFVLPKLGAPLPNMLNVLNNPIYYPASIALTGKITGKDADGDAATLFVLQAGESKGGGMEWSLEVVEVEKLAWKGVHPVGTAAFGTTYPELAAKWWQWALQTAPDNPVEDTTGACCGNGQEGPVWFLAGTFGGSVVRQCNVPADKAIFLPVVNTVWWAPEDIKEHLSQETCGRSYSELAADDPCKATVDAAYDSMTYEERTGTVADLAAASADSFDIHECVIDGRPVKDLSEYRVVSPPFSSTLAVWGDTTVHDPLVADGYWLLLEPLPAGKHEIWFRGGCTDPEGPWGVWETQVTYELMVGGGGN